MSQECRPSCQPPREMGELALSSAVSLPKGLWEALPPPRLHLSTLPFQSLIPHALQPLWPSLHSSSNPKQACLLFLQITPSICPLHSYLQLPRPPCGPLPPPQQRAPLTGQEAATTPGVLPSSCFPSTSAPFLPSPSLHQQSGSLTTPLSKVLANWLAHPSKAACVLASPYVGHCGHLLTRPHSSRSLFN
ncbi:hypothetical protein P7K49_002777 [Saguinus oedipus]|uniref:Uncharacterized protein n=1 Tax=Saguinus oedipus TaxID=9490 RepID=A0ABQ9WIA3_SAGOE|nr:hypothetical protein P7K49_002777 [Saguinus oedipus]